MNGIKVIAAGMIRSGSTWQYNVLKTIMEQAGLKPRCFWVEDYKGEDGNVLIKTHEYKPRLIEGSIIFTAIRDEAEIKGSMRRRAEFLSKNPDDRFNGTANLERYPRYYRWFRLWREISHYKMNYNEMTADPLKVINDHIKVLGLTGKVEPLAVLEEVNNIKPPAEGWDANTFLHAGHITKQ